jgi:hypothetical protein
MATMMGKGSLESKAFEARMPWHHARQAEEVVAPRALHIHCTLLHILLCLPGHGLCSFDAEFLPICFCISISIFFFFFVFWAMVCLLLMLDSS